VWAPAGFINSVEIGNTDILPDAETVRILCFRAVDADELFIENDIALASESRGIDEVIFPSVGTSPCGVLQR